MVKQLTVIHVYVLIFHMRLLKGSPDVALCTLDANVGLSAGSEHEWPRLKE